MFELREATADQGRELFCRMHREHEALRLGSGRPSISSESEMAAAAAGFEHYRVLRDGHELGALSLRMVEESGRRALHVGALWVNPEQRGRGVGRQLVHVAESAVRARHARRLVLEVDSLNTVALRLYSSTGFVVAVRYYFRAAGLVSSVRAFPLAVSERLPADDDPLALERVALVAGRGWRVRGLVVGTRRARWSEVTMSAVEMRRTAELLAGFVEFADRSGWPVTVVSVSADTDLRLGPEWRQSHATLVKEV